MKVYNKKEELADWIRKKLGSPIISVPISSEQLEDCIDDAVDYATVFLGGVGNEEQFVVICTQSCSGAVDRDDPDYLPSLEEGNCTTVLGAVSAAPFLFYKAEYQLPRNVVAIKPVLPGGSKSNTGACQGGSNDDSSIMQYAAYSAGVGAVSSMGGVGSVGTGVGLYLGGSTPGIGALGGFGTRGGSRMGGTGIDLVSYELGMQYLEMINQLYTIKMSAQFMEQTRRVRFSPRPGYGTIILPVWARVADKWMYENIFVRRYALALAKLQVGMNLKLYGNMTLPGGVTLNAAEYTNEGKAEQEKLEDDVLEGKYSPPPDFFVG